MTSTRKVAGKPTGRIASGMLVAATIGLSACHSPLDGYDREQIRREVVLAARQRLHAPRDANSPAADQPLPAGTDSPLASAPQVFVEPGEDLDGQPAQTAPLSLDYAVRKAVEANLDVRIARLLPQIREQQLIEARGAFDPAVFSEYSYQNVDQPLQGSSVGGIATSSTVLKRDVQDAAVGLTQPLLTGGEASVSTGFNRVDDNSPNLSLAPDPGTTSNVTFEVRHPLLRNFGSRVNRAQIRLADNAHAREVLALRGELLTVIADVEAAYWQLLLAWRRVGIRQQTLELTLDTQRELEARRGVDVSPLQLAQAASFVEERRTDLIDARRALGDASDQLKRLLSSDEYPLASERVLEPTALPTESPLPFSVAQAIARGLEQRPEIDQEVLNVDDASIRVEVADNQKLPSLQLTAEAKLYGLDSETRDSYAEITDGDFVEYLVGARLEAPIGNRTAKAVYERARLARLAQSISLRRTADDVVLSIKQTMRAAARARDKIATTRLARRATAENLRTLTEREETGEALTPEFLLDLKLDTQRRLADAELREIAAIVEYNVATARFYAAIGGLLDRHGVVMDGHDTPADSR